MRFTVLSLFLLFVTSPSEGTGSYRVVRDALKNFSCKHLGGLLVHCEKPNNPPSITCVQPKEKIAPPRSVNAAVTWALPTAHDHEDGDLTPTTNGPAPGFRFTEGSHPIEYVVTDSKGAKAQCVIVVVIKVIKCSVPSDIVNGRKSCTTTSGQTVRGDSCSFSCNSGYKLIGSSTVTCSDTRVFKPQNPSCNPLPCPPPPSIVNGKFDCKMTRPVYLDACYLHCDKGFRPGKGFQHITCQANKTWSHSASCIDDTPPIFTSCPLNVTLFSERGTKQRNVTWDTVIAVDPPTNKSVTVTLKSAKPWGTYFDEGQHIVVYEAVDSVGNIAKPCSFKVTVETLRCPIPNLHPVGKHLMRYGCTEYIYGTDCPVSCQSGYPLGGPGHITCEIDKSYPPVASWTWNKTSGVTPYCMVKNCTDLRSPDNGAMTCDKWMHGRMCQMQCNRKFNFPVTAPKDGMYVCGQARGKWLPSEIVPDCLPYAGFSTMKMPSYFYYDGSCSKNPATRQQIRENFIKALTHSLYGYESCTNVSACKAENVQIFCGRESRSVGGQSSSKKVVIKFDIVVPYDESAGSGPAAIAINDQRLHKIAQKVQQVAQSSSLGMDKFGLTLNQTQVEVQKAGVTCPKGRMPDMATGSCIGCTKGSYLNDAQKICVDCPIGTFQDKDASASCIKCPHGTTTASIGSENDAACRGVCPAGHVSPDGLKPCSPCPLGTYQRLPQNEKCTPCVQGQTTRFSASTDAAQCTDFDISIGFNSVALFKATTSNLNQVAFATWIYLFEDVTESIHLATWQNPMTEKTSLAIVLRNTVEVIVKGSPVQTSVSLPARVWTHFLFQMDGPTGQLSLYLNGKLADSKKTLDPLRTLISQGHRLTIRSSNTAHMVISRLVVYDHLVSNSTIVKQAASCVTEVAPHVLDMTSLDAEMSDGAHPIVPGVCGEPLMQ